ncbi:patatin-like phospholipase domain-containing protein 4 [Amphiura filiformis]|uniref:patatin-like phospholipase domain-containing protein 4 n=1 Tax=Amphiura filiformis TaxID=82378 RepID=UPI003B2102C5
MGEYLTQPYHLSFAGNSFMGITNLGSAQCLVDHGLGVLQKAQRIGATSSSAMIAAVLATAPNKLPDYLYLLFELIDEIATLPLGAISPGFDLIHRLRSILLKILPEDAHIKASQKLHLKATLLQAVDKYQTLAVQDVEQGTSSCVRTKGPKVFEIGNRCWSLGQEVELVSYASREDLIEVLLGCIYVPWFPTWQPPQVSGKILGDSALSRLENFHAEPSFHFPPGKVIKISPDPKCRTAIRDKIACGWVDTTGQRFEITSLQMFRIGDGLYPPPKGHMEAYYADGYEDATKFLKFYHSYDENEKGNGPRSDRYAAIHSPEDLKF